MANQIKMAIRDSIYGLYDKGWSQRRIAGALDLDREMVCRYLRLRAAEEAKPAILPTGTGDDIGAKPAISPIGAGPPKPAIPPAGSWILENWSFGSCSMARSISSIVVMLTIYLLLAARAILFLVQAMPVWFGEPASPNHHRIATFQEAFLISSRTTRRSMSSSGFSWCWMIP